ncbi:flagellar biosynthesis anti-sigma factor FlgM [Altererythrobacter sp. H2]|uniref:flagellar biosynthesis anti-sigma factor FlgM n=1 Tax=Altererythrobacter sp. H2 TaxID=3108391 RepID=UPI000BCDD038|nr:flagellar biosynthesis anti-sigma factor FlgM [Altererythrobacter sp. H2]OZA93012.1 MAG: flagellar biosynthesis anti-sigma factor FlgM [Erythrobacter sp. 34-65-8]WRK96971.1 flagellar biosynthesis anti-sigma factor FlgM [Altererythrobacter sp. H2]
MSPIDIRKTLPVNAAPAISGHTQATERPRPQAATSAGAGAEGVQVELGATPDSAAPPVDRERVNQIRDALREGSYPIVPAKIADAMIAARLVLGGQA